MKGLMPLPYIDLHTHLLPQVDDGAASLEDSLAMLDWYAAHNFATIVATPHLEAGITPTDIVHRSRQFDLLVPEARRRNLTMLPGAEIRLDPQLLATAANAQVPLLTTYPNTTHLLVDFPSFAWPFYAEETLFRLQTLGYTPHLAHPERYFHSTTDLKIAQGLVDRGVALQVILGSFVGVFGKGIRNLAIALLEAGLVSTLATDAHGAGRRLDAAGEAIIWLRERYDEDLVTTLLHDNPRRLVNGEIINPIQVDESPRQLVTPHPGRPWWRRLVGGRHKSQR